jgi:hypothetical protein
MSGLINYLTASKGSLMCNNNQYIINRCLYEKTYYRCCIHKQFKCPATLTISDDKIEYISENHNHDQYLPVNAEYIIMLSNLKMITASEKLSIADVKIKYNNIYNSLEIKYSRTEITPHWTEWSIVRSTFYKLIKNNNENKTIATNSKEIELATELTLTTNKKLFLIEYQKSNSTMIFLSEDMAECLRESIQWCFDCTFKSSPSIFKQILTVFGIYNDIPIPCAFAFLPNKEKKTYINVIKKI